MVSTASEEQASAAEQITMTINAINEMIRNLELGKKISLRIQVF